MEGFRQREAARAVPGDGDFVTPRADETRDGLCDLLVIVDDRGTFRERRVAGEIGAPIGLAGLGASWWFAAHTGNVTTNSLPFAETAAGGLNVTTMQLEDSPYQTSPNPSPLLAFASGLRDLVNGSNTRSRSSAAIPIPLSRTRSTTSSPSCSTATVIWPPGSVYLAAFSTRFVMT